MRSQGSLTRHPVTECVRRLWWMVFGVETGREVWRRWWIAY